MTPTAVIDLTEMVRLVMQRPERSPLFQAWEKQAFIWAVSEQMLAEFAKVTDRPKIQRMIRPFVRDAVAEALRTRARIVIPALSSPRCRDPKDDVVIATAVAAASCYLVTADRDLYGDIGLVNALRELSVTFVQAGEFLAALQGPD